MLTKTAVYLSVMLMDILLTAEDITESTATIVYASLYTVMLWAKC